MGKFIIGPHMRLQEWVAEEKGFSSLSVKSPLGIADIMNTRTIGNIFEEGLKGRKSFEESVVKA